MGYSEEQIRKLIDNQKNLIEQMHYLVLQCVLEGNASLDLRVREHLLHGAARRIGVMRRALENIFTFFPPSTVCPLPQDLLADVQINLHAFVINLSGIFDNWAWAFILRHDLEEEIGDRRKIGIHHRATNRYFPSELANLLAEDSSKKWHQKYLKSYRDALAHRIPLYIPPAEFNETEANSYNSLEREKVTCIKNQSWDRLEEVWEEQNDLGLPSFVFLHSFTEEDAPQRIMIHPQLISDSMTVVEFGNSFFENWHDCIQPPID